MNRVNLIILIFGLSFGGHSQIISQFTWESNPPTNADIGPNATSISGSATVDVGGVGGTNGLNAGLPKANITMILPGSPVFDVAGIDVSFDAHREENSCDWFDRGNYLRMDGSSNLSVTYRVDDGGGGFTQITSGNVFAIPNDDTYRNYRFVYLPDTGEGFLMVDGAIVWTNDGPDNRDMYWTGAGDITIGAGCDGTGFDDTFMDNLIIASVSSSPLPVELMDLTATVNSSLFVDVDWTTKSESNNDYFTIEKSQNGQQWTEVSRVDGAGNSSQTINYHFEDQQPYAGISYYRLKQTDFNGDFSYSEMKSVNLSVGNTQPYPNPSSGIFQIDLTSVLPENLRVIDASGRSIPVEFINNGNSVQFDLSELPPGVYFLQVMTSQPETHRIIKR